MILSYFVQLSLGALFFGGFVGAGLLILKVFKIEKMSAPLTSALSFFISLCVYVWSAVIFLIMANDAALPVLKTFSLAYVTVSFLIVGYFLIKKNRTDQISWTSLADQYGFVFIGVLFSVSVFFLGAYRTSLLDEWLHRPIIKFFVTNGEFPLKNPYQAGEIFTERYHYGLDILVSAVQLLTNIGISESLDVVKIGFVIASFLLFYGIIFEWSQREYFSIWGAIFLLFSGSSFFLLDAFSATHWLVLGESLRAMNYPLLYLLLGVTWVNLPLTLAFLVLFKKLFYDRALYSLAVVSSLIFLLIGFYLISELFAFFLILSLFIVTVRNIYLRKIHLTRVAVLSAFFVGMIAIGIYLSGGVMVKRFKINGILNLLYVRDISSWGYSSKGSIISPVEHWLFYLKNFFLEGVIAVVLTYGLIRKKITIAQQPLLFLGVAITFIVPFIFSTPMGDLNLYKLTAFGIILLHILFFYYFSNHRRSAIFYLVTVLFVFGSIPAVFTNYNIQFGENRVAWAFRCSESDLCYDKFSVDVLKGIERNSRRISYVLTAPENAQEVVDVLNAYAVKFSGRLDSEYLEKKKIQYIFVSPKLRMRLNSEQLQFLGSLEKIAVKGRFEVLRYRQGGHGQ